MVEGARLECVYAVIPYRGFESHPLRQPSLFELRLAYASKTAEARLERGLPSDLQSAEADFRSAKAEALAKEGRSRSCRD